MNFYSVVLVDTITTMSLLNSTALMSDADYFDDGQAINAYMDTTVPIDVQKAKQEHAAIKNALQSAGVTVIQVAPPEKCQDGVYTANWALVRGDKAVLSRLPNARQAEEPYAQSTLEKLGKQVTSVPDGLRFSGQGDALPCGDLLFMGSRYRTDPAVHDFIAKTLGYKVISLQTIPKRHWYGFGPVVINNASGWPDSYFYDIDLALAVLRAPDDSQKGLIAWCPKAFTYRSRALLRKLDKIDKLEVDYDEAVGGFACNLVSTGKTVVMSDKAPKLRAELEKRGFSVITPAISELAKGGGYIRCTTLTLS